MKTKKVREVIKMLLDDGWFLAYTKGDYRQFKHPTKKARYPSIKSYQTIWMITILTVFSNKQDGNKDN